MCQIYFNLDKKTLTIYQINYIKSLLSNIKRSEFIFNKQFKVKAVYDYPKGKWPSVMGDAIFLDSTKLQDTLYELLSPKLTAINNRLPILY